MSGYQLPSAVTSWCSRTNCRVQDVTILETLLAVYDEQMRARTPRRIPAGVTYEQDGPVLRIVGQSRGFISTPRDVGLRGPELDRLIARQRDFFAARGETVEWKTRGHDEPADLVDRLRAAGFVPEDRETVLVGLTAELAAEPVLPDGVTLRQVTEDADLHRVAELEAAIWGPERLSLGDELIRRVAADPGELVVLIAEASGSAQSAGQVVSAAWLEFTAGADFGGLWGGSTLPRWRGRGIYRALVARRAQLALARGVTYLQVDASDDSRPILQRLGLHAITTTTPYVWSPPKPGA